MKHDPRPAPSIRVSCYSGSCVDETPRRVWVGSVCLDVEAVEARWRTPDGRGFRVRLSDGRSYVLTQDGHAGSWELTT